MDTVPNAFEQLKQMTVAKPFEPFVIERRSGNHLLVIDAMCFVRNGDRITVVNHSDRSTRFRAAEITRIRTIKSVLQ